jgi:hypothetical protein
MFVDKTTKQKNWSRVLKCQLFGVFLDKPSFLPDE